MLAKLKENLAALPARREQALQGQRFEDFLPLVRTARLRAIEAVAVAESGAAVLPDFDAKEVLSRAKKAAGQATRLWKSISANPSVVSDSGISDKFATLDAHAQGALKYARENWKSQVEKRMAGRKELAIVVERLLPGEGRKLRELLEELNAASNKPPSTAPAARRVQTSLETFDSLVTSLKIDKGLGKFIQQVAGLEGAPLSASQLPEVLQFLKEHPNLWEVFRIRL